MASPSAKKSARRGKSSESVLRTRTASDVRAAGAAVPQSTAFARNYGPQSPRHLRSPSAQLRSPSGLPTCSTNRSAESFTAKQTAKTPTAAVAEPAEPSLDSRLSFSLPSFAQSLPLRRSGQLGSLEEAAFLDDAKDSLVHSDFLKGASHSLDSEEEKEDDSDKGSIGSVGDYGVPKDPREYRAARAVVKAKTARWHWTGNPFRWTTLDWDRLLYYVACLFAFFLFSFCAYFAIAFRTYAHAYFSLRSASATKEHQRPFARCPAPCRLTRPPPVLPLRPEFAHLNITPVACNDVHCLPQFEARKGALLGKADGGLPFLDFRKATTPFAELFYSVKDTFCDELILDWVHQHTLRPRQPQPATGQSPGPGVYVWADVRTCRGRVSGERVQFHLRLKLYICHDAPDPARLAAALCPPGDPGPRLSGHFKSALFVYVVHSFAYGAHFHHGHYDGPEEYRPL